jgi:hypothetical protein
MKKGKKGNLSKKKKFFIIISCYIALFLVTSITTSVTLAWFHSSTWQTEDMYLGGPVYITFSDNEGNPTSGENKLVTETPENWSKLYPGMNIKFQASCMLEGHEWQHTLPGDGGEVNVVTSGAVLRARIMLEVTDPDGNTTSDISQAVYNNIYAQLKYKATSDDRFGGKWVFHQTDPDVIENNFFYYVEKNQAVDSTEDHTLVELGGVSEDTYIDFLKDTVITVSPTFNNDYADCKIKFTIIFHAVQAFFPYTLDDLGTEYENDETGREVIQSDIGTEKPRTIKNSIRMFKESLEDHYSNGNATY